MASAKVSQPSAKTQQVDPIAAASRGEIISTRPYLPPPIDPTVIEKESYIPFEFAQAKVMEVSSDLHLLKLGYEAYIEKLQQYHTTLQQETKSHYENYILNLKQKALQRIEYEKHLQLQKINKLENEIQLKENEMEDLRDLNATRVSEYQGIIHNLKGNIQENEKLFTQEIEINKECLSCLHELVEKIEIYEIKQNYQKLLETEIKEKKIMKSNLMNERNELERKYQQQISEIQQNYGIEHDLERGVQEVMINLLTEIEIKSWNEMKEKIILIEKQLNRTQLENISHEEKLIQDHQEMIKMITDDYEKKMKDLQERLDQLNIEYNELNKELELHLQGEQNHSKRANQLNDELHAKEENISQLKGQMMKSVAQKNIEDVFTTINMNETKTQLNDLNNQLQQEKSRSSELERLIEQLRADIAVNLRNKNEKERADAENMNQLQQQINELQQQLQQQLEVIKSQQDEIQSLKEINSSIQVPVTESLLPGPSISSLERQTSKLSKSPRQENQEEKKEGSSTISGSGLDPSSTTLPSPSVPSPIISEEELQKLQQRYNDLQQELQQAITQEEQSNELKISTKNEIKKWMKEFEKINGRPPNNEEKSSVKEKFVNHKQANEAAVKASSEVERIRTEITQCEEHIRLLKESPTSISNPAGASTSTSTSAGVDTSAIILSHEYQQLHENYQKLQNDYQILQEIQQKNEKEITILSIDNKDLLTRLDNIRNEKRTDLVARLETENNELREKLSNLMNEIILYKTEKTKNELKINELNDRVTIAEKELKERDERELQVLTIDQETHVLKTQVTKQRDEIIMKSKAATAGWDAAANAEEKLDLEIEKAYNKGLLEGKKMNMTDLQSIHEAIEIKEQKIMELIEKCADADKRTMIAEKEKEETLQQLMTLNHYIEMMKLQSSQTQTLTPSQGQGQGQGVGDLSNTGINTTSHPHPHDNYSSSSMNDERIQELEDELEKNKERLEETQEEMVNLLEQIDELNQTLQISEQKIRLLEQMVSTATTVTPATSTTTTGGIALNSNTLSGTELLKSNQSNAVDNFMNTIRLTIEKGTKMWNDGKKDECYDLYDTTLEDLEKKIKTSTLKDPIAPALVAGRGQAKRRGAVILRKALDSLLIALDDPLNRNTENSAQGSSSNSGTSTPMIVPAATTPTASSSSNKDMEALRQQLNSLNSTTQPSLSSTTRDGQQGGNAMLLKRIKEAETEITELKKQIAVLEQSGGGGSSGGAMKGSKSSGGNTGADPAEIKALQKKIKELETQLNSGSGGGGGAAEKKAIAAVEKKYEKQAKELEKITRKEKASLESRIGQLENDLTQYTTRCNEAENERDVLRQRLKEYTNISTEMEILRNKALQVDELNQIIQQNNQQIQQLTAQYKKESQLRKQYKNELEDLKGAIRVYARVRPLAQYEIERNCQKIVEFPDETSVKVQTSRGEKEFEFDAAFTEFSTQEQVFEDTKRLVESFLDGFNVCLFAYGQTGSGKTFTMTGSESNPGLTPRAITEMFRLIGERTHCTSRVSTYFVELYNDNLVDLYWLLDNKRNRGEPPKLDIKLDAKKMVFIKNAVVKDVRSASELMDLFHQGNAERHVGATKMNAESSRSHSIFAIMVETYDSTTKKTVTGKLSLVDLAGSERADKTGAGAERLREAQSINKSLSALGDVISALSEGEKFIPYRNNKLTQLMQDSLGGNAKTLMFVNFSPADYNADETVTSLSYATRVKKITNNATKQAESEEIAKLKAMIKKLQGGGTITEDVEEGGGEAEEKS